MLERRVCPGCGRAFRCLPTSVVVFDSKFCAYTHREKPRHPTKQSRAEEQRLNPNGWRQAYPIIKHPWLKPTK